jgi:hypothetical protein
VHAATGALQGLHAAPQGACHTIQPTTQALLAGLLTVCGVGWTPLLLPPQRDQPLQTLVLVVM